MGIVQKAIAAGVPIAAVPFGRDQPEVARRVIEAGAGVQLKAKDLTPERLRATVREAARDAPVGPGRLGPAAELGRRRALRRRRRGARGGGPGPAGGAALAA